jgi:hypothetical protein
MKHFFNTLVYNYKYPKGVVLTVYYIVILQI